MIAKILFALFYPWVRATLNAAYNDYIWDHKRQDDPPEKMVVRFMRYHLDDYMKSAFKKHWRQIIFNPSSVLAHAELYEYRIPT